jgi:hypothetical protein
MSGSLTYEYFVGMNLDEWKELTRLQKIINKGDIEIKEKKTSDVEDIEKLRQHYLNKNNK